VAELLAPYGETAQVIGYLHDVAEDTNVPLDALRLEFGDLVADCVAVVTDSAGANRIERKQRTNAKLAKIAGETELALIVKAADRLANLQMSARGGRGSKLAMYREEHADFCLAAYRPGLCDDLWRAMDEIVGTGRRD
jgi:(p)ppGpp synthase/HD superfamily hydrolase